MQTTDLARHGAGPPDPRVAKSRAKLLEAATELLVDGGARAVTVDAVSDRSGVAKSTLYRHFPSRTDLLVAVLSHNIPEIDFDVAKGSFEESLRSLMAEAAAVMSDPDWSRVLPALMSLKSAVPDVDELTAHERSVRLGHVVSVLDKGIAEGLVPQDVDVSAAATMLLGPLMFAVMSGEVDDLAGLGSEIADFFMAGCRQRIEQAG